MDDLTVKRISELPYLVGTPTGNELLAVVSSAGVTSKYSFTDLSRWVTVSQGLNSPPRSGSFTESVLDTAQQVSGNLLVGASDPNGDPITFERLVYKGVSEPFNDGSFQTDYGIFFMNPDTGAWVFTLGSAARALNIGDVAHEIFTYTLADGKGGLATAALTISITGTNSVPVVNYVNGQTPINTTISGNLIQHYAFDYESTLTVLHYKIDGLAGTWAPGTSKDITGVGNITIQSNGDYIFVPENGFYGPVPLIIYTLTDVGSPANQIDAYFTLAVTPLTPGAQPVILKCTASGPTHGGEDDNGCYMTVWGFRMGNVGGLGTTTKLKIGEVEVARYMELINDPYLTKWPGLQRLRVQVGHLDGLELGKPYPVVVTVNGQDSNANNIFTPNPGRIFFVSKTGNNNTAVIGDIDHPFRNLQMPNRGDPSCYPFIQGGDWMVIRGGDWSDLGYDTAWFRFRDPQQNGSNPNGASGSGYIHFTSYPGEVVHYTTPPGGNKGGIQGPGSAFSGSCGDWVGVECLQIDVSGGSSGDAAPINMQYNTGHWNIYGNNLGPWPQGDSPVMNAACVTGQGNFIEIFLNWIHDVEGVPGVLQNHGIYAGTSSYGWKIAFNQFERMVGGSGIQSNDSDGGTGIFDTPFGTWQGFTDFEIHNNWIDTCAKYGITFSDVGSFSGDLSAKIYNNVIINTQLPAWRLNTTTTKSDVTFAFNTVWNCMQQVSGTGTALVRNEGTQSAPLHSIKNYNNIFAFGPNTAPGCGWYYDYSGQGGGYSWARNLYFANGQTPSNVTDTLAIYGDPKFTDTSVKDFSLQPTSPAANAGTQPLPAGMSVSEDFTYLSTRQFGGAPDIGAFEIGQNTPYPIVYPSSSGGPRVGVATSVNLGTWGNSPTSYSRQFEIDSTLQGSVDHSTGSISFTPTGTQANKILKVEFTVNNAVGGTNYTLIVGPIAVGAGAGTFTSPPSISGTAQVGNTLSCSTGTVTGGAITSYTYQWLRNGDPITLNGTSSTYDLISSDLGFHISCKVGAVDNTNGTVFFTTAETSAVLPPAADPVVVQSKAFLLPSNTGTAMAFDAPVANGNIIVFFCTSWDQSPSNFSMLDTQGHTRSDGSIVLGDQTSTFGDNPRVEFMWTRSNASGSYTATANPQSEAGNAICIMIEIQNPDPTTVLDVPESNSQGSTAVVALTSGAAMTKAKDLVLVGLVLRSNAQTMSTDTGWTNVITKQDGTAFMTAGVFSRKPNAIETPAFTSTLSADIQWNAHMMLIKGT